MNCRQMQELAPLWLSGELEGDQRADCNKHLRECAACDGLLREQALSDDRIRQALAAEDYPAAQTVQAVQHRIAAARHAQARRFQAVAGLAAALLTAVFTGYVWRTNQQSHRIFADAARDHRLEVTEHLPRRWRSDLAEIGVLARRFGLTAEKAQALAPSGYRLLQAKTCGLDGHAELHLVFSDGAQQISLYVRPRPGALAAITTAEFGAEALALVQNARYSALAVATVSANVSPEECREMALHAANLL